MYTFDAWVRATGLMGAGELEPGLPIGTRVIVRRNPYEAGRAHVVIYNWDGRASVAADLSSVLRTGAVFEVHNVQDLLGPPVVAGIYAGGAVTLAIDGVQPPAPIGAIARAPSTGTRFNVYVVTTKP